MVGIVIVSHSKALATSVYELAQQAAEGALIVGVGGTGENGEEFGTDAMAIMEAIQSVYSEDGVVLLMDMGSALLSAQTALEFLGEDMANNIKMCSGPIVEGAIIASVQSKIGADINTIIQEIQQSLEPKQEQVGDIVPSSNNKVTDTAITIPDNALSQEYVITNQHGLHARPAATFVQEASKFDAQIYVCNNNKPNIVVSARSLNSIAKLNIRKNDTIKVHAWGPEAQEFINILNILVLQEFGENPNAITTNQTSPTQATFQSKTNNEEQTILLCISRGVAVGKAWVVTDLHTPKFERTQAGAKEGELDLLDNMIKKALATLNEDIISHQSDETTKEILEMHKVMLQDPELVSNARQLIQTESLAAEQAWWQHCKILSQEYSSITDNEYLQARAVDCIDIGLRVLRESSHVTLPTLDSPPKNAILFIEEVSPDVITRIDLQAIQGIVTKIGGKTSHAAIIARSHSIPMISGFDTIDEITNGAPVVLDATNTMLDVHPSEETIEKYSTQITEFANITKNLQSSAHSVALSKDTIVVDCVANIGSRQEIGSLLDYGVDGVGLFRTEFLFLNRQQAPDEEEQFEIYSYLGKTLQGKQCIVRLLDIGADKQLPYLTLPKEANPFLGLRGIRFDLKYQNLLIPQLRALLRAAALYENISVMIPMIVDVTEIQQIQQIITNTQQQLQQENIAAAEHLPLGIMIETPASVVSAKELAQCVEFFSIGSNDLIQYTLAVDRESTSLSSMYDVCHPAVLRILQQVINSAQATQLPVSICGESAADIEAIPLLLGMGIRKLSASPAMMPAVKHVVRELSIENCEKLLRQVWSMDTASEIRDFVRNSFSVISLLSSMM